MFKKQLVISVLIWLTFVLGSFGFLYFPSPKAKIAYERLMNHNYQTREAHSQSGTRPTQQKRYQVSKQILYKKGLRRMQSRLISDHSDLIYSKKEGELVEKFRGLICTMQEEWVSNSNDEEQKTSQQMIRQLQANEGRYSYKSGQLEAEEVKIAHYLLPGDLWPDSLESFSPLLQGKARLIHLSLFKEPSLKAQGFQATFYHWREN